MDKKSEENTTSVKIYKTANQKLDVFYKRTGVGKIEVVSRLVDWICAQDKTLQAIILGQIDKEDESSVLDLIKKRLDVSSKPNLDVAVGYKKSLDDVRACKEDHDKKKSRNSAIG